MPNHVINEIVFRSATEEQREAIMAVVSSPKAAVDFEVLLPIPLNYWWHSVGQKHEKAFPGTALDWCRQNWSTKWNAYGLNDQSVSLEAGVLTLTFQTAWGPPMGWLCALFNKLCLSFEYHWLSEGGEPARKGSFKPTDERAFDRSWSEEDADEQLARHLHKLLWGVESFEDEPA